MEHLVDLQSMSEFFGVEPKLAYPDIPYENNSVEFDVQLEDHNVWFNLIPHLSSAELRVRGTPYSIVMLLLSGITHLSVRKTADAHYMRIAFRAGRQPQELHLRPRVCLFWGNGIDGQEDPHLESAS